LRLKADGIPYALLRKANAYAIMEKIVMAGFIVLLVGCAGTRPVTQPLVYSGGDGSSPEQAVVVREANCREVGSLAQRLWLQERFPGYREAKQSALDEAKRHYEVFEFATADGEARKVYFDTTDSANK
jgi:hypothetical protein